MNNVTYYNIFKDSDKKESDPTLYQNTINDYKNSRYDVEKDILLGMKNSAQLETADMLRIQQMISSNPEIVEKIVLYFKDNREKQENFFAYIPPLLNEDIDEKVEEICNNIASSYEESIGKLGKGGDYAALIDIIRERFLKRVEDAVDQTFEDFLNEIEEEISSYESDIKNIEFEEYAENNKDNIEESYYQAYKNGRLDEALVLNEGLKEVGQSIKDGIDAGVEGVKEGARKTGEFLSYQGSRVKYGAERVGDKVVAGARKVGKGIEWFEMMVNKLKKKMEEKKRDGYYKRYMKGEWRIKRFIKRLLILAPVSAAVPVIGLLVFFYFKIFDVRNDLKFRRRAYDDLNIELKIIDEKISDAESSGDKEAKVKMMREKDKLERVKRDIERGINI